MRISFIYLQTCQWSVQWIEVNDEKPHRAHYWYIQTRNFQRLFVFFQNCMKWGKQVRVKPQALVLTTCVSLVVRKKLQKNKLFPTNSQLWDLHKHKVNTVKMIESRSHVGDPHTHSLTFFFASKHMISFIFESGKEIANEFWDTWELFIAQSKLRNVRKITESKNNDNQQPRWQFH